MSHVAFIGLGNMGGPMAKNMVKAGYAVRGYDLVPELCDAAEKHGVEIMESARQAAKGAEAIITVLPAGRQVLAAVEEMLPAISQATLVIDCSTIDVASAQRLHALVPPLYSACIDAPVSGGVAGARAGSLTFLCGGAAPAFNAARPFLETMGANVLHCGGPGMGQAAKLCNNMVLGATMIATAEAFVLGESLGLSHQALFEAMSISSGQSWSLTKYCPVPGPLPTSPANDGYRPGFMASLMLKDLTLAQNAASEAGVATPLGALSKQLFALYDALGHGANDFSGIVNLLRGRSAR